MSLAAALSEARLFAALDAAALEELGRFMTAAAFQPGEIVFRQGDAGDRLLLVADGELEVLLAVPGSDSLRLGVAGRGDVVGELSLLGTGVRTATVRAVTPTTGWALARSAFEILRHDVRPAASQVVQAIGRQAVTRLDQLYRRSAEKVSGEPGEATHGPASWVGEVSAERGEIDYLAGVLFFTDFDREQIAAITRGLPRLAVPRGAVLTPAGEMPAALWIVVRGVVQTTMRGADTIMPLRLAGPGRGIGHVGLLGADAFVERVESRARERSILLEVSWPRVRELLTDEAPASRRFAAALWTDVVRALQHGERPLAHMRTPRARESLSAFPR